MEKYKVTIVNDRISTATETSWELHVEQPHKISIHEVTGQIMLIGIGGKILGIFPNTVIFEHLKSDE